MKVLFIGIIENSVNGFLRLQIEALKKLGHENVIVGGDKGVGGKLRFKRKPALISDIKAVYDIHRYIRKENFDLVVSIGPKTGFLMSLVSLCNDTTFVHNFTGQIWANYSGLRRVVFKWIDLFILKRSQNCLVDSAGQKNFLLHELGNFTDYMVVTNNGSICGVDEKFLSTKRVDRLDGKLVVGYLGRISKDKGFDDFLEVAHRMNNICSFRVRGSMEGDYILPSYICYEKATLNVIDFFEKIDVFLFPSYREGFGMAAIEASACGIPVICYDIYGMQNTILHGYTGMKISNIGDYNGLIDALMTYVKNEALLHEHSLNSRDYVKETFSQKDLLSFYCDYFNSIINKEQCK